MVLTVSPIAVPSKMIWTMCWGSPNWSDHPFPKQGVVGSGWFYWPLLSELWPSPQTIVGIRPILGARFDPVTVAFSVVVRVLSALSFLGLFFPAGHDVFPTEEFRPLRYSSASTCFWEIPLKCTKVGGTS
ncbi:hypothetical protein TIFTF001_029216 [Ficus carica]|uniref:Uncharacterized protein n=1 Tax=Ficus carica TaxID=3494 RepID=A0AA88DRI2_FICCA|nr:hypothetical protein TIFTF001_029216 [Ficus carica]